MIRPLAIEAVRELVLALEFVEGLPHTDDERSRDAHIGRQAVALFAGRLRQELPAGARLDGGAWVFALPMKLQSPNVWVRGSHWGAVKRHRDQWRGQLVRVICDAAGVASEVALRELGRVPAVRWVVRSDIVRLVPSERQFIRDDDNLPFAPKPLHDALTASGLIRDDRRQWLRMGRVRQAVWKGNEPATVVVLRPAGWRWDAPVAPALVED
jgi:hypothetical protein